jgi:hypothetical protein
MVTKNTTHSLCIILGMHKSGTSFLVSSLFNSGFSVGHDVSEIGYQKSKGESPELLDINSEILGTAGLHSTSIIRKRDYPYSTTLIHQFLSKQEDTHLALKDPRMVLTYRDHWKPILPEHKIIITFRNPFYVMRHYARNVNRTKWRTLFRSLRAWRVYNKELLQIIERAKMETFITEFETILNQEEERKHFSQFVGIDISFFTENRKPKKVQRWKLFAGQVLGFPIYQELKSKGRS